MRRELQKGWCKRVDLKLCKRLATLEWACLPRKTGEKDGCSRGAKTKILIRVRSHDGHRENFSESLNLSETMQNSIREKRNPVEGEEKNH